MASIPGARPGKAAASSAANPVGTSGEETRREQPLEGRGESGHSSTLQREHREDLQVGLESETRPSRTHQGTRRARLPQRQAEGGRNAAHLGLVSNHG